MSKADLNDRNRQIRMIQAAISGEKLDALKQVSKKSELAWYLLALRNADDLAMYRSQIPEKRLRYYDNLCLRVSLSAFWKRQESRLLCFPSEYLGIISAEELESRARIGLWPSRLKTPSSETHEGPTFEFESLLRRAEGEHQLGVERLITLGTYLWKVWFEENPEPLEAWSLSSRLGRAHFGNFFGTEAAVTQAGVFSNAEVVLRSFIEAVRHGFVQVNLEDLESFVDVFHVFAKGSVHIGDPRCWLLDVAVDILTMDEELLHSLSCFYRPAAVELGARKLMLRIPSRQHPDDWRDGYLSQIQQELIAPTCRENIRQLEAATGEVERYVFYCICSYYKGEMRTPEDDPFGKPVLVLQARVNCGEFEKPSYEACVAHLQATLANAAG